MFTAFQRTPEFLRASDCYTLSRLSKSFDLVKSDIVNSGYSRFYFEKADFQFDSYPNILSLMPVNYDMALPS